MTAISKEYLLLFNTITDTEQTLSHLRETLLEAQRQAEELFLEENPAAGPAELPAEPDTPAEPAEPPAIVVIPPSEE